jgi:flagellar basal body-associated protein FliL
MSLVLFIFTISMDTNTTTTVSAATPSSGKTSMWILGILLLVLGFAGGAAAGYFYGEAKGMEESATMLQVQTAKQQPSQTQTNPLQNVKTNPFQ